jgi:hypothetical protein
MHGLKRCNPLERWLAGFYGFGVAWKA